MRDLMLAIDAGTRAVKAAVIATDGVCSALAESPYSSAVAAAQSELEPRAALAAMKDAVRQALSGIDAARIAAIGVSAQLGLVAVDNQRRPLRPALTWIDKRACREADFVREKLGEQRVYEATGKRIDPERVACLVLWLQRHETSLYARTDKFLSLKDYLVAQLTGAMVTDRTHAGYTLLADVAKSVWHEPFFSVLGLESSKFPPIHAAAQVAGGLSPDAAADLGLEARLPVAVGGPDGTVAALGAGVVAPGDAVSVIGTTDVVFACTSSPVLDPQAGFLVNPHAVDGCWLAGGPMSLSGGCVEWFCDRFGGSEAAGASRAALLARLDAEAARLDAGAEQLLFFPTLVGSRAPNWEPAERGALVGLSPQHGLAHIYRAILEGSSFASRRLLERIRDAKVDVKQLRLVGGGARSELWAQIRADVFGVPLALPQHDEATGLGSACLAAVAAGLFPDVRTAMSKLQPTARTVAPNRAAAATYDRVHEVHGEVEERLRDVYVRLASLSAEP